MEIESGLLLGAIGSLAGVVVYLWRRIEKEIDQERKDHLETKKELKEVRDDLMLCRVRVAELERINRELKNDTRPE